MSINESGMSNIEQNVQENDGSIQNSNIGTVINFEDVNMSMNMINENEDQTKKSSEIEMDTENKENQRSLESYDIENKGDELEKSLDDVNTKNEHMSINESEISNIEQNVLENDGSTQISNIGTIINFENVNMSMNIRNESQEEQRSPEKIDTKNKEEKSLVNIYIK